MKNQLKKVAIDVDTTCFASDNSDSETNAQGAVAMFGPSNPSSVIGHNHVSSSVEVVLCAVKITRKATCWHPFQAMNVGRTSPCKTSN